MGIFMENIKVFCNKNFIVVYFITLNQSVNNYSPRIFWYMPVLKESGSGQF